MSLTLAKPVCRPESPSNGTKCETILYRSSFSPTACATLISCFRLWPPFNLATPAERNSRQFCYEVGEIAEIPRLLLKGPGTACNPRIRTVQFNLIPMGLPIEKHEIDTLTMKMVELSQRRIGPRSALGYAAAARC